PTASTCTFAPRSAPRRPSSRLRILRTKAWFIHHPLLASLIYFCGADSRQEIGGVSESECAALVDSLPVPLSPWMTIEGAPNSGRGAKVGLERVRWRTPRAPGAPTSINGPSRSLQYCLNPCVRRQNGGTHRDFSLSDLIDGVLQN